MTKLLSRRNWFKKKGGSEEETRERVSGGSMREEESKRDYSDPETVIFVPSTPRGELVKRLREADDQFRRGSKVRAIKFIERAGTF